MTAQSLIHASCVAMDGRGVLLLGNSGCGKSDVALRLIDAGAVLVGDDQIGISNVNGTLVATPAPRLEGMIEARGVGILEIAFVRDIPLALAVKLVERTDIERMPEPVFFGCAGLELPLVSLHAFDGSTVAKIRMILARYA